MPSVAASFRVTWRVGRAVLELAAPHRKGTIRAVQGTGQNANVIVNLPGHPPASFRPSQLKPL